MSSVSKTLFDLFIIVGFIDIKKDAFFKASCWLRNFSAKYA